MPTDDLTPKSVNITGSEYVTLTSEGTVVKLSDLRNYVLRDLLQNIGLDQVDNTADINKPLSSAQRLYIDSRLLSVENKIEQLVTLMSRYIDTESKL